jgi:hypothetical protein
MKPVLKSTKQLTCGNGRSITVHPSISLTTSKRADNTTLVQPAIQFNDDFHRVATTNALKLTNASCINENPKPSQVEILQKQHQNITSNLELTILLHGKLDYDLLPRLSAL